MFQLTRSEKNPVVAPAGVGWEAKATFNPAVVWHGGVAKMLYRALGECEFFISRLGYAESADGATFARLPEPVYAPRHEYDAWSAEDPRAVEIDGRVYVTYVAVPQRIMRACVGLGSVKEPIVTSSGLLSTDDFRTFTSHGIITPHNSDNKDVVLFPEKIGGRYAMLHRPNFWTKKFQTSPEAARFPTELPCPFDELPERPSAWVAYSDDLVKWDSHALVTGLASDGNVKIGPGVPPIKTDDGWLVIYHHVRHTDGEAGLTYEARVALLDLADPRKVVAQLPYAILAPEAGYEREGLTKNVIFPTGAFIKDGTLFVYYGAADTCCGLATGGVAELLAELSANRR